MTKVRSAERCFYTFLSTIVKLADGYLRVKTTLVVKGDTTTDLHSRMQIFWNVQANVATLEGRDLFCVDITIGITLFPVFEREDRSGKVTTSAGNQLPVEILLCPKSVVNMPDSLENSTHACGGTEERYSPHVD
ncbi:MAG: hypothetical protein GY820_25765 [Gammaproteobacteria bacterium]|nr:hypothetical protein [Gammaproteobacteria bacterium]